MTTPEDRILWESDEEALYRTARGQADTLRAEQAESGTTSVRLSVNLAPDVAQSLKDHAKRHGYSITEAVRQAIALMDLVHSELRQGRRIYVFDGPLEESSQGRELVFL